MRFHCSSGNISIDMRKGKPRLRPWVALPVSNGLETAVVNGKKSNTRNKVNKTFSGYPKDQSRGEGQQITRFT